MVDLKRLQKRRVAAKGWATRSTNVLADLLDQKLEMTPGVDPRLAVLDAKRECEGRLAALDDVQSAVECELDPTALEGDLDAAWAFRDRIKKVMLRAEASLQTASEDLRLAASASGGHGNARLPKLELPRFQGDVLRWGAFWEAFESAVDQTDLSEVTKLTYLRSLLGGEALRCVEGLALCAQSYYATCELLKNRFGRQELIIFSHVQQLLQISGSSGARLQTLVDELMVQVRSLEALGITGQQYGVILTPLLLSRLPTAVRLEWARTSVGKESDLQHLLDFLQQEICRLERSGVYADLTAAEPAGRAAVAATGRQAAASTGRPGPAAGPPGRRDGRPGPSSTAALQMATLGCGYCGQHHTADKCGAWQRLSVAERFGLVREKRLCFCCLQPNHLARRCAARCERCGGRHHVTLCDNVGSSRGSRGSEGGGGASEGGPNRGSGAARGVESGRGEAGVSLSCTTGTTSGGVTLLPVASVLVQSPAGKSVRGTLIFDSGADRSFVTKEFRTKLSGAFKGSVEMSCASFGGHKMSGIHDVYEIGVSALNVPVSAVEKLRVVEVEAISAPLRRPPVPANLLQPFSHLPLAVAADCNSSDSVLHIDLVVGQDQYWSLVKSGLVRSGDGLVAMETAFGWVLSGSLEGRSGGAGSV